MLGVYLVVAVLYAFPVLQHHHDRITNDPYDPILNTSILWWNATTIPLTEEWWNPPHYYPTAGVAGFTENLLGVSVMASPIFWLTNNALSAYNLSFFLTFPLSAFTVYLLAFALTRRHDAAFLAGLSWGFTPYRTAELGHLQMLSVQWFPLCLLGLHRFLETRRARWLVLFVVAWILQALANGYFIFFGAVIIGLWVAYFCTTSATWRAMPAIAVACVLANVPLLPIMLRYHAIHEFEGLRRGMHEALAFSSPPGGFISVSQLVVFWHQFLPESEDNLFPGVTALIVVLVGIWYRAKRTTAVHQFRHRSGVIIGLAVLTALSATAIVATLILGPWQTTVAGIPLRMSGLDRAVTLLVLCSGPLLVMTTSIGDAVARRSVLLFYVAATVAMGVLCFGPVLQVGTAVVLDPMPYKWLMAVPGFDQLRVPTRFWMLGLLCLALAAGLVFARLAARTARVRLALLVVLASGLLLDGWTHGINMAEAPPQWPRVERRDRTEPILELPLGPAWDAAANYRSMRHRRRVMNGVSGYDPWHYEPLKAGLNTYNRDLLLAIASLRPLDVVVNGDADPDGAINRYVAGVPGVTLLTTDGPRSLYRVPMTPWPEVTLGPKWPIAGIRANAGDPSVVLDGNLDTDWFDGRSQQPGQWLSVDLGTPRLVAGIGHGLGELVRDFPRRLAIDVSADGVTWTRVWEGPTVVQAFMASVRSPRGAIINIAFAPHEARFVVLRQLDIEIHLWRVTELSVHAPPTAGSVARSPS
jgi:hypothetical protein